MWGTATSAYQSEGFTTAGNRGPSVWDTFIHLSEQQRIENNATAEHGNMDYEQYESKTVPLLQDLGVQYYRLSISWTRILSKQTEENPKGVVNQEGIDHYKSVFASLKKAGIEPVVTMWHWDTPQHLESAYGGWLNRQLMPLFFAEYAKVLLENFGSDCKYWITLNEPLTVARAGYSNGGHHPPGRCSNRARCKEGDDDTEPYLAGHTMIVSHGRAFNLFKNMKTKGTLPDTHVMGIALNAEWCEPMDAENEADRKAAQRCKLAQVGWFFDPIYFGRYPRRMTAKIPSLPAFTDEELDFVEGSHMNVYFQQQYTSTYATYRGGTKRPENKAPDLVKENLKGKCDYNCKMNITMSKYDMSGTPIGHKSDANNWLFSYGAGFRRMQKWISDRYSANGEKMSIIVSENGWGQPDKDQDGTLPSSKGNMERQLYDLDRCNYYRDHIGNMTLAMFRDQVDVRGYFAWTLVDNFEWLAGYTTRFGLTHMDYKTDMRTPKLSFRWLQKHVFSKTMGGVSLPTNGVLPPCSAEEYDKDREAITKTVTKLEYETAAAAQDSKASKEKGSKNLRSSNKDDKKVHKPDQVSAVKEEKPKVPLRRNQY